MTNNSENANIIEVFSSIQGEGPYVGCRQIFIRFAGCNLNCDYCDTKFSPDKYCKIESFPASGTFKNIDNPVTVQQLVCEVDKLTDLKHHSISLTGGEPLLSSVYIAEFIKEFRKKKDIKFYLETNGTLTQQLESIISLIDIVSMDLKLESSTNMPACLDKHKKFIEISQKFDKEIFAKVVVTRNIAESEIADISSLVKSLQAEIPIILQPVDSNDINLVPDPEFMVKVQDSLLKNINDVRIIPQVHKFLKLL